MKQVLFEIAGIPMYGFGAMLFVCFVAVTVWGSRRAKRTAGMPPERFQDMVIWLFVSGIIGARVLYMIQYASHFPDQSIVGLATAFFKIWEGGIIFYGSALGGVIGYALFYQIILRKFRVSGWRLADAVAPLLALGLALGRIGCYLNGCCWGQVACEECRPVPLGAAHFPLLPAHSRQMLVREQQLQTATGFVWAARAGAPGSEVTGVEAGSPAARAGLRVGDRITAVNGEPNEVKPTGHDRLDELIGSWPRGKSKLTLTVNRDGTSVELPPFAPATIGLYPTQLYETVSMVLLIFLLLAYYPYRRHDGQVMVLLMIGYALHRFINESLRIEPTVGSGLTLSQWGSVVIFAAAIGIEIYLRRTMPSPPEPLVVRPELQPAPVPASAPEGPQGPS
ncbi:MAG TPA: prolipoprotein diacylglyceryl transferase family protein [Gemmata sp.]